MEQLQPQQADSFKNLQRLFWDRKLREDDLVEYPMWILERVLDYGSLKDVRFLMDIMGRDLFLERVSRAGLQSAKTRIFWHKMLEKEGMSCTRKYSRNTAWNY